MNEKIAAQEKKKEALLSAHKNYLYVTEDDLVQLAVDSNLTDPTIIAIQVYTRSLSPTFHFSTEKSVPVGRNQKKKPCPNSLLREHTAVRSARFIHCSSAAAVASQETIMGG